jgi:hypothetical protein
MHYFLLFYVALLYHFIKLRSIRQFPESIIFEELRYSYRLACLPWQAFEKTLGCPGEATFAPRRFSLALSSEA